MKVTAKKAIYTVPKITSVEFAVEAGFFLTPATASTTEFPEANNSDELFWGGSTSADDGVTTSSYFRDGESSFWGN